MTTDVTATGTDDRLGETVAVDVSHVDVTYKVRGHDRLTVRDISFQIGQRESFGLVGESGCGKTTMALALTRYLARNGRVSQGSISVIGQDLASLSPDALRTFRARTVSMVYQEPGRALNPSIKVGRQVAEVFEIAGLSKADAAARAEDALRKVQISDPGRVLRAYPHQLSGGMLQRVVIAMALGAEPSLLILDEPTTALDATVEAEILELVSALREEFHTAILFISHNLAVIAKMCERVGVMYAGELVERGPAREIFEQPRHPYTVGLLRCIPRGGQRKDHGRLDTIPGFLPAPGEVPEGCIFAQRCALADDRCRTETPPPYPIGDDRTTRCHHHDQAPDLPRVTPEDMRVPAPDTAAAPVITLRHVAKTFTVRKDKVHALTGVDLDLHLGETLGLVGESGSGKTTLARLLVGLSQPDPGSTIELEGHALAPLAEKRSREQLRGMQIVFQNPDSALNRRHTVRHLISRSLTKLAGLAGKPREERLQEIVRSVRMEPRHLELRPAQLSGGLKQRVAIARAFAGEPYRAGVRRAHVSARRVGSGGDPEPAGRPAGQGTGDLPVHLPRPRGGPVPSRPDRRALPGPGHGVRGRRDACSPGRTIPTPRRCSRRCRAWTGRHGTGSSSAERSRVRPIRPRDVCSTPAARAAWIAGSASQPNLRWSRSSPAT